jgi:hypothetical protein
VWYFGNERQGAVGGGEWVRNDWGSEVDCKWTGWWICGKKVRRIRINQVILTLNQDIWGREVGMIKKYQQETDA